MYTTRFAVCASGNAPSNLLQNALQAWHKFDSACGSKYSTALGVSDALGFYGVTGYAVAGVGALSNALTTGATATATQLGSATGTSAGEVLATWGGAEATSGAAVTIAQGASLAGNVLGTVAKIGGAVAAVSTVASLGIRAGCAAGIW